MGDVDEPSGPLRELLRGNPQKAGGHFAEAMRKSNLAGSDPDGGCLVSETIGDMQLHGFR